MPLAFVWAVLVSVVLVGCGPTDEGPEDAGMADAAPIMFTVAAPEAPAAPELPRPPTPVTLAPCPDGWTMRAPLRDSGATVCQPFAAAVAPDCADATMLLPGRPSCAAIEACPAAGEFAADVPSTSAVFVRAGAAGGDGSRASPFGTIGQALAAAADGATIAIASGVYSESLDVARNVTLRGACARDVHIDGGTGPALGVQGDLAVSGVSLRGTGDALVVEAGAALALSSSELVAGAAVDGTLTIDRVRARGGAIRVAPTGALRGGSLHASGAPITVTGGTVELSGAFVDAPGEDGLAADGGATVTLGESVVARATGRGVGVDGERTEVALEDVAILDVTNGADAGTCVEVAGGGSLVAARLFVAGCAEDGLRVQDEGSVAHIEAVAVEEAGFDVPARRGHGVTVVWGGHLEASGLVVDAPRSFGVTFFLATAYLEDLFVLDPTGAGTLDDEDGLGLIVGSSHVSIRRALVRGTRMTGIFASDPESQLHLADVTVSETRPAGTGKWGRGLSSTSGSKISVERVLIEDSHEDGVFLASAGASLSGTDLTVRRTHPSEGGGLVGLGFGVHVQEGAVIDVRRVHVEESHGFGVVLTSEGTRGRFFDMTIVRTQHFVGEPLLESFFGRGFEVQRGAEATIERLVVTSAHESGVAVTGGGRLELTDAWIRDTEDDGFTGKEGRGLTMFGASFARIERARIENNRHIGVSVYDEGGEAELVDVEILGTRETSCADAGCEPGGIGLGAYMGGRIRARRFIFANNVLAGVQVAAGGQVDLDDGEIRGSPIGANVQDSGYDVSRLSRSVRYTDNGTNLDSTSLPVPMPGATFDGVGEAM